MEGTSKNYLCKLLLSFRYLGYKDKCSAVTGGTQSEAAVRGCRLGIHIHAASYLTHRDTWLHLPKENFQSCLAVQELLYCTSESMHAYVKSMKETCLENTDFIYS